MVATFYLSEFIFIDKMGVLLSRLYPSRLCSQLGSYTTRKALRIMIILVMDVMER